MEQLLLWLFVLGLAIRLGVVKPGHPEGRGLVFVVAVIFFLLQFVFNRIFLGSQMPTFKSVLLLEQIYYTHILVAGSYILLLGGLINLFFVRTKVASKDTSRQ